MVPEQHLGGQMEDQSDSEDSLVPEYIEDAPDFVRRRVRALKKLQLETVKVKTDFYRRLHELETEFRTRFNAINQKREQVVSGKVEPTDEQCDVKLFNWMSEEQEATFNSKAITSGDGNPKGIPDFWLHTLKSLYGVRDAISEQDEPVLRFLTDINVEQTIEPATYTLKFAFAKNPYFSNQVLTKQYTLSIGPSGIICDDVFYPGPLVIATKGCKIDWKEGTDVTKKAEDAQDDDDSFFSFFSPVTKNLEKGMQDQLITELVHDFEIGRTIRKQAIDKAVLYFTQEIGRDCDSGSEEKYEGEEERNDKGSMDQ